MQSLLTKGVDRFTKVELEAVTNGLTLDEQINEHRNNNESVENTTLLPDHNLKTRYKYNSLNQLVWQKTPDGGETRFAYDNLGRIIASQNAKQLINNTLSYTSYDELGRIVEAGEMTPNVPVAIEETTGKLKDTTTDELVSTTNFPKNISDLQREVTRTTYTEPVADAVELFQTISTLDDIAIANLRNRVTAIYYFEQINTSTLTIDFNNAIYYNYDIHGNVVEMVQHNKLLTKSMDKPYSGIKRVQYQYDLISGNVNKVYYQKGRMDQFIHKYHYDADNRIVSVETSSNGQIWEKDASYNYYAHGPLARTVLGDNEVQGVDYAYTLQGWLKGVNSDTLNAQDDMGSDGTSGSNTGSDAFGYALTYFDNDYSAVGTINAFVNSNSNGPQNIKNLYNGNIKQMATTMMETNEISDGTQINHYEYDQLNRIIDMKGSNVGGTNPGANYNSSYTYDNNGNLITLNRTGLNNSGTQVVMDELSYNYLSNTNQLGYVSDAITNPVLNDIGSQSAGNYDYDEIGQLTKDINEGITNIDWRVDGKVASITKSDGSIINFHYDGLGNRVAKTVLPENITTVYSRDAQGNVMAVYETNETDINNISSNKTISIKEHHIYGSSRLGIEQQNTEISNNAMLLIANHLFESSYERWGTLGNATVSTRTHNLKVDPAQIGDGVYNSFFILDGEMFLYMNITSSNNFSGDVLLTIKGETDGLTYYNAIVNKNGETNITVSSNLKQRYRFEFSSTGTKGVFYLEELRLELLHLHGHYFKTV